MRKYSILFFFFIASLTATSQIKVKEKVLSPDGTTTTGRMLNDTLNNKPIEEITVELDGKTHYTDYKIISFLKDTTIVDTTLSIQKERVYNYIRKNNFELLPLHNVGQTFNRLGYDFSSPDIFPEIGVKAKQFNFFKTEDIDYYRVPTPTTELFFHTAIQQGHVLNSLLTANVNPQLNVSVAYKGLRSLGNYRNALSSHQNFRLTASYTGKANRYVMRTHYAGQNLWNEENGGLTAESLDFYTTNDEEYRDRERLETQFTDAESRFKTRRYYLEHGYNLWYHPKDSVQKQASYLQIGQEFMHKREFYTYAQDKANVLFGTAYQSVVSDSTAFFRTDHGAFMELKAPWVLGKLKAKAQYSTFDYGYNSVLFLDDQTIPARINKHNISFHARWDASFKTFGLQSEAGQVLEGAFKGHYLKSTATFSKDSLFILQATLLIKSQAPNFTSQLYQSAYVNYNWAPILDNEHTRFLGFSLISDQLLDAEVSLIQKDFYTYFDENSQPQQFSDILTYLKVKAHKELKWRKWALDNTAMYQKVTQGADVFHVPDFVTEHTLYFSSDVFKRKPMYLQTGITLKYFTNYFADEFNPLINEFVLQNQTEIGNYPLLEFFANARVQRARLFFKLENLNSLWDPGKYFSTPTQPYRDFTIRFGMVWNFFI
jgi:hypothetical protein